MSIHTMIREVLDDAQGSTELNVVRAIFDQLLWQTLSKAVHVEHTKCASRVQFEEPNNGVRLLPSKIMPLHRHTLHATQPW